MTLGQPQVDQRHLTAVCDQPTDSTLRPADNARLPHSTQPTNRTHPCPRPAECAPSASAPGNNRPTDSTPRPADAARLPHLPQPKPIGETQPVHTSTRMRTPSTSVPATNCRSAYSTRDRLAASILKPPNGRHLTVRRPTDRDQPNAQAVRTSTRTAADRPNHLVHTTGRPHRQPVSDWPAGYPARATGRPHPNRSAADRTRLPHPDPADRNHPRADNRSATGRRVRGFAVR